MLQLLHIKHVSLHRTTSTARKSSACNLYIYLYFYFSFLAEKSFYDFKCVFWFSDHPTHVVTNLLQSAPPLSLAELGSAGHVRGMQTPHFRNFTHRHEASNCQHYVTCFWTLLTDACWDVACSPARFPKSVLNRAQKAWMEAKAPI